MLVAVWKAGKALWPRAKLLPLRAAVALGSTGLGEPPRPDRLWKGMAIVLPVGLAAWCAIPQVTWVMSPSIDAWAVRAAPGVIRRGDLVSFRLSHSIAGPRPVNVTKYALCLPGDRISMIEQPSLMGGAWDGWYYCNSRLLGVSKAFAHDGRQLEHWRPDNGRILPGTIYVGSRHESGFDSRYYGPVAIERLTRMERVL